MGLELSFCGSRDVILWVRDVILWVLGCHFVDLEMSFCGSRYVILWVFVGIMTLPFGYKNVN